MSMTFDEWVSKTKGKGIDWDGVYGVQCVDLVNHYVHNVLGVSPVMIGNAIEFYNKRNSSSFLRNNFNWISNYAAFVPAKGDIGVFKTSSGYGHVCVCDGCGTTSYFYSYDQNWGAKHQPMTRTYHRYTGFLGVLRPKNNNASSSNSSSKYFPKYTGNSGSIVDSLKAVGADSSYAYCKKIALANSISNYRGTASQNIKMLTLLKQGKLIKP